MVGICWHPNYLWWFYLDGLWHHTHITPKNDRWTGFGLICQAKKSKKSKKSSCCWAWKASRFWWKKSFRWVGSKERPLFFAMRATRNSHRFLAKSKITYIFWWFLMMFYVFHVFFELRIPGAGYIPYGGGAPGLLGRHWTSPCAQGKGHTFSTPFAKWSILIAEKYRSRCQF